MAFEMRPTGLSSGFYKDTVDYSIFCGEWCIGRIYEILGTVEAPDVAAAKAAAAVQFELDDIQRNRIIVQDLA
jgi:hypothetical protein